jgi:hypothetical protein
MFMFNIFLFLSMQIMNANFRIKEKINQLDRNQISSLNKYFDDESKGNWNENWKFEIRLVHNIHGNCQCIYFPFLIPYFVNSCSVNNKMMSFHLHSSLKQRENSHQYNNECKFFEKLLSLKNECMNFVNTLKIVF